MTGEASTPALRFSAISKSYGQHRVLHDLSFEVADGEFFGLIGVNGAGKTTCIKALLDFCDLDDGEIEIFGVRTSETHARSRLAYLPERFLPPYYLSGRDFLVYMSKLHGQAFDADHAEDMARRLDLDVEALNKSVRDYSKGMAQKLGLAACLGSGKALVILDEPMSGLDPKARILVKRHLLELKSRGVSVLISTHMLADAEQLCDRMGVLHGGRLRFVGTPAQCCLAHGAEHLEEAYLSLIEAETETGAA